MQKFESKSELCSFKLELFVAYAYISVYKNISLQASVQGLLIGRP